MDQQEKTHNTSRPKFVDVTPETERLKELDHFWIEIERRKCEWCLWRFSYLDTDTTELHLKEISHARFNEPILLIHGINSSHIIFNWFARELWIYGFRNIFAIDFPNLINFDDASNNLANNINVIKEITKMFVNLGIPDYAVEVIVHEIPKTHWGHKGEPASEIFKDVQP